MNSASEGRVRLPRSERRAQLLQAAQEVFVSGGYHATAMDEIAPLREHGADQTPQYHARHPQLPQDRGLLFRETRRHVCQRQSVYELTQDADWRKADGADEDPKEAAPQQDDHAYSNHGRPWPNCTQG
jgi:hypothetical protein